MRPISDNQNSSEQYNSFLRQHLRDPDYQSNIRVTLDIK